VKALSNRDTVMVELPGSRLYGDLISVCKRLPQIAEGGPIILSTRGQYAIDITDLVKAACGAVSQGPASGVSDPGAWLTGAVRIRWNALSTRPPEEASQFYDQDADDDRMSEGVWRHDLNMPWDEHYRWLPEGALEIREKVFRRVYNEQGLICFMPGAREDVVDFLDYQACLYSRSASSNTLEALERLWAPKAVAMIGEAFYRRRMLLRAAPLNDHGAKLVKFYAQLIDNLEASIKETP
jgi:hypothetical protein